MSNPTSRNRLDGEQSPYLQSHADNPVHWQPWDEAAREAARERDVPIFLSIGYSACHWCHVMAEESFEDEAIASILNEQFVPVKVDREERPDVDSIYMTICQQVTGRGGWPLSVWLTPDGRPFYVGTYFPKEPRRGQPGFSQLLTDIAESWNDPEERDEIESRADQWASAIEGELEDVPDQPGEPPEPEALVTAADAATRGADREHGGWGSGQKFPQPGRLDVLMRAFDRVGRDTYEAVVEETLDAMASGGLYDHVGGGFHRYTTDREWVVPHFEKMLYDNAELPRVFLAGYQLTGTERYADVAAETFEFLQRELQHPEGGFYSTLDARSEGEGGDQEEGAFYVWQPDEIHTVVSEETDADLFCDRYGVRPGGNFEKGQTVLTETAAVDDLASEYEMEAEAVERAIERARDQVFKARTERPRPPRDEKVLAGWNGLAISALASGALVLDEGYADVADDALSFVREKLWDADASRLKRRYKDGETKIDGYLEDYAFLGRGALDLYQATAEVDYLAFAMALGDAIVEQFWDSKKETLYFTPIDGEQLIARPQELTDQSTPSSTGVAAALLLELSQFRADDAFEAIAGDVIGTHSAKIEANPSQHASLALAADTYATGALELTLVADGQPSAWRETLGETYLPNSLFAWRPGRADALADWLATLDLNDSPPIWAQREMQDGEPTVYACRSFACSPPRHDIESALSWAADNAAESDG
jgi:uncharacterized protein YyaL (SSP411 family)